MWKDFESRFRRILDSLSRHRRLIAEQANLLFQQQQMADRNQMFNLISHYQNDRENAIEDQRRQEQNDARKSYLEVLQWFSAADTTASDQQGFTREREEYSGTGRWILEDEKVRNWREADAPRSSVLWVTGKPGAGMTRKNGHQMRDSWLGQERLFWLQPLSAPALTTKRRAKILSRHFSIAKRKSPERTTAYQF